MILSSTNSSIVKVSFVAFVLHVSYLLVIAVFANYVPWNAKKQNTLHYLWQMLKNVLLECCFPC